MCSDDSAARQRIAPLRVTGDGREAWRQLLESVAAWPRVSVLAQSDSYLHVTVTSAVFRFVDDVEFARRDDGTIAMRSAARCGYWDMGVNRRRLQRLRRRLYESGVVRG